MTGIHVNKPPSDATARTDAAESRAQKGTGLASARKEDLSGTDAVSASAGRSRPSPPAPAFSAAAMAAALTAMDNKFAENKGGFIDGVLEAARQSILSQAAQREKALNGFFTAAASSSALLQAHLLGTFEKDMQNYVNSRLSFFERVIPSLREKATAKLEAEYLRHAGLHAQRVMHNLFAPQLRNMGFSLGITHLSLMRELAPSALRMTAMFSLTYSAVSAMRALGRINAPSWEAGTRAAATLAAVTLAMTGFAIGDKGIMDLFERLGEMEPHNATALSAAIAASMLAVAAGSVTGVRSESALHAVTAGAMARLADLAAATGNPECMRLDFAARFAAERALFQPLLSEFSGFTSAARALFIAASAAQIRRDGV